MWRLPVQGDPAFLPPLDPSEVPDAEVEEFLDFFKNNCSPLMDSQPGIRAAMSSRALVMHPRPEPGPAERAYKIFLLKMRAQEEDAQLQDEQKRLAANPFCPAPARRPLCCLNQPMPSVGPQMAQQGASSTSPVEFFLCSSLNTGQQYAHASKVIDDIIANGAKGGLRTRREYKIGIAINPLHRWGNAPFGYALEGCWSSMTVFFESTAVHPCALLEAALIDKYKRQGNGCLNQAPGGEGISITNTSITACYTYVVVRNAASYVPL
jgi:hypothetical protein